MKAVLFVIPLALVGGQVSAGGRPVVPPKDLVEMVVKRVVPVGSANVVILKSKWGTFLPIWIGTSEAMAIALRLAGRSPPRPLTHDLLERMLKSLGARVVKVHIEAIRNQVFLGRIFLRRGRREFHLDARPSDSIALAVGANAPIYAARRVLKRAGRLTPFLLPRPRSSAADETPRGHSL